MAVKIIPKTNSSYNLKFNSLSFIPEKINESGAWAIFSHGYTASKSDCLSWAQRLSEAGIPCIIFDQPGHLLGSFNQVPSFELYTEKAHCLFEDAFYRLKTVLKSEPKKIILGGHSLSALLSIKALGLETFDKYDTIAIGVGIGISQHKTVHLFESDFYQKTLNIRRQLVVPELDSDLMFPWIKEERLRLNLTGKRIHLITGEDDVVVGTGGMEAFKEILEKDNNVTVKEPKRLPHHEPSMAATHIYSFLRKELNL